MKGNDERLVKQKIRERYKGVSEDVLDFARKILNRI